MRKTRPLLAVPMLVCQGPSFYFEKGHNSKTILFRVIPLVLQLHLVMMSKNSKFGVDTFNTNYNSLEKLGKFPQLEVLLHQ